VISINDYGIDVPVGEQVNYMGFSVESYTSVVRDCLGCCFEANCDRALPCNSDERIDKIMVKFKEVK